MKENRRDEDAPGYSEGVIIGILLTLCFTLVALTSFRFIIEAKLAGRAHETARRAREELGKAAKESKP